MNLSGHKWAMLSIAMVGYQRYESRIQTSIIDFRADLGMSNSYGKTIDVGHLILASPGLRAKVRPPRGFDLWEVSPLTACHGGSSLRTWVLVLNIKISPLHMSPRLREESETGFLLFCCWTVYYLSFMFRSLNSSFRTMGVNKHLIVACWCLTCTKRTK